MASPDKYPGRATPGRQRAAGNRHDDESSRTRGRTVKAVLGERYGPPDVLELREVEKPALEDGKALVRVRASSANAADWHGMRGGIARLFGGLRRPKDPRMGSDVAGTVEAVGRNVTRFKPGDEVFGTAPGAFAEFALAREDQLALKPAAISFEQAATVPIAGTTALQGLRDRGHVQAGQKVLINGASGGVGTFAVQIARSFGPELTAVCSTQNVDQAHSLGADHVMDYTREDFAQTGQRYDLIYEIAAHHSIGTYKRCLNPGGRCVIAGIGFPHLSIPRFLGLLLAGPLRSRFGDKDVRFMGMARINETDLTLLGHMIESKAIAPVIDRTYPLEQAAEAMRYLGTGHARGKIVVTVIPSSPR